MDDICLVMLTIWQIISVRAAFSREQHLLDLFIFFISLTLAGTNLLFALHVWYDASGGIKLDFTEPSGVRPLTLTDLKPEQGDQR